MIYYIISMAKKVRRAMTVRTLDMYNWRWTKVTKVKTETVSQSVSQSVSAILEMFLEAASSPARPGLTNLTSCGDWRYPATSLSSQLGLGKVILIATITSLPPSLHNYLLFLSLSHVIWRNWQWSSRELGINCFPSFCSYNEGSLL